LRYISTALQLHSFILFSSSKSMHALPSGHVVVCPLQLQLHPNLQLVIICMFTFAVATADFK